MSEAKKRLGGLGKLSDFGRSTPTPPSGEPEPSPPVLTSDPSAVERQEQKKPEKLVTINIKIARNQQEWLADTARQVRDNNLDPVPSADRCYPQHLIQAAIDLLASSSVDWSKVRSAGDLRKQLNL